MRRCFGYAHCDLVYASDEVNIPIQNCAAVDTRLCTRLIDGYHSTDDCPNNIDFSSVTTIFDLKRIVVVK